MSSLWIDMTDLRSWKGSLTGIQRVVHNMGIRFKDNDSVRYFYFDPTSQTYLECDFGVEVTQESIQTTIKQPLHHPARQYAIKIARRMPEKVKRPIRKAVSRTKAASTAVPLAKQNDSIFKDGDTILVLGGNWGDNTRGFLEGIALQKKRLKSLRLIHVVYDLLPQKYPNLFLPGSTGSYVRYLEQLIRCADLLPCISEATKKDLDEFITSREAKGVETCVFHLGEDTNGNAKPIKTKKIEDLTIKNPFIISVGTMESRKNHHLLYLAYKEANHRKIDMPNLYIIGRRGWMTGDTQHHIDNDPEINNKIKIIDDANDNELAWFYSNCMFVVYPSMYEGWGLPLSEAASYGKLCLASDNSSMPEVMGDIIDYFSPFDSGQCLEKIVEFYNDPSRLRDSEKKIKSRTLWSWDNAYTQFIEKCNLETL